MAEWSKALVLKTRDSLRGPWVRIPLPPLEQKGPLVGSFCITSGGSGRSFSLEKRCAIRKAFALFLELANRNNQKVYCGCKPRIQNYYFYLSFVYNETMNENMVEIIETIVIAVVVGVIMAVVNHFLISKKRKYEEIREMKRKAYSELLDSSRAFMDDPSLSEEHAREVKKRFIAKYYNEIILFADKKVQQTIESFIQTGGVSSADSGEQVSKFKDMVVTIRKDLDFDGDLSENFKMYSLEITDK